MRVNLIAIFMTAALMVAGCGSKDGIQVRTERAGRGSLEGSYLASGRVTSQTVGVSPEVSGKILEITVDETDKVTKGQVLVVVEDQDQTARIANLEAGLATARSYRDESRRRLVAKQQQLRTNRSKADAELDRALWRFKELQKGARQEEILRAEAILDSTKAELEQARKERERTELLFDEDIVSEAQLERVRSREKMLVAQRTQASNSLAMLKQGPTPETLAAGRADVAVAQAIVEQADDAETEVSVLEQQLESRELEMVRAQRDLEQAQLRWSRSKLLAPDDGIVTQRLKDAGEIAHYGAPVLTLMLSEDLWIEADVAEQDADFVRQSQRVTVTFPARPGETFQGTVEKVAPSLETPEGSPGSARFLHIEVKLDDKVEGLRAGLEADVKGVLNLARDAVLLPRHAVFTNDGNSFVLVVRDRKVAKAPVVMGAFTSSQVEIKSGLNEGDEVIVEGAQPHQEGTPISGAAAAQ